MTINKLPVPTRTRLAHLPLAVALMAMGALTFFPVRAQSPSAANTVAADNAESQAVSNALLDAAEAAYKAKDWQKAVDGYSKVLALQPTSARAVRWRGAAHSELGQHELAIADRQKAIDLEPNSVYSHNGLCWSLILANQPAKAQTSCVKAQQLDPMNMSATVNLANTYLLQGNKAEAWKWYEQSIGLIDGESDLVEGPLEDFTIFEKRGWQVELVKQASAEFEPKARQWLKAKPPLDELLKQADKAAKEKDYPKSISLLEQRISALGKQLSVNHPRLSAANTEYIGILNTESRRLYSEGEFQESARIREQSLAISEKVQGPDHPSTGISLNNLAGLYRALGQYAKAEPLYLRALAISEKAEGPEHPDTGTRLNNLAGLYESLGQYAKAEPLRLRSLAISEKAQGPEHPDTGTYLNNLAALYESLGQYAKAEPLYLRALAISEKAQGPEHPSTGICLNNLAELYRVLGQHTKAEPLYLRALAISEKVEGPEHPSTGSSLNNLALLYGALGQYAKAEPLYLRALAISEKAQGPEHPSTGTRLHNLASLYLALGQYAKAEPLLLRSLAISEKAEGPEHPSTGNRLNSLAELYRALGQYAKAEPLYLRALAISEKAQGPEHPNTGISLNNLAGLYESLGQYAKAEPLYLRALAISEKAQGPEHPDTGTSLNNLAELYRALGQYAKAEPFFLRALAISEKAQGPEHPSTGTSLNNLAGLYRALGQYAKAEPLLLRSLAINEKVQGPEHPNTGISLNNLAELYRALGQYAKAEPLYLRALRIANGAKKPDLEWNASGNLMYLFAPKTPQPDFPRKLPLAIWYGKQSVNALQVVRDNIKALDKQSQQSFLKQNESTYEFLANLLIEDSRLAEAEQVLAMLKDQELQELTRSGAESSTAAVKQVEYSGAEIALSREFETLSKQASAANSEREALKTRQSQGETLGAADQARIAELDMAVEANRKAFDTFMARLQSTLPPSAKSPQTKLAAIPNGAPKMEALLRSAGPGHAGLQYVVTEDRLSILFSTPEGTFARQINLEKDQLKTLVLRLKDQLKTPDFDPQPTTLALHKLLIEPIAPELAAAKAHTLVLNLTDFLRYIPFGALHDGKGYLLEKYAVALYTPASNQAIAPFDAKAWQVAGMGATQATKFEDDNASFKALPAVKGELAGIVRTSSTPGGALPGQITLDPDFTRANFSTALTKFPVVHVASHYQFAPNSEHRSYLVLGDGNRLSLAELNRMDFTKVQLLALSACDTASGGGRNEKGSEIEGLGAAVQRRGAKAVLATLWPVADESTASVMQRFYQLRSPATTAPTATTTNTASTALALRQAQLELLTGQNKLVPSQATVAARSSAEGTLGAASTAPANTRARPYMHDPDKPFAHPYYWAPFILMGNWL